MLLLTALVTGLFMMNTVKAQKGNYISIETGYVVTGSANKLNEQLKQNSFGHFDSFTFLGIELGGQYPRKSNDGGKFLIRYGRELKNNHSIEIAG